MKKLNCENCGHYDNEICHCLHLSLPPECDICANFYHRDTGNVPRFCKIARSIEDMAKAFAESGGTLPGDDSISTALEDRYEKWLDYLKEVE